MINENENNRSSEMYGSYLDNSNNKIESHYNKTKNESESNKENTKHFICKICNIVPLIKFISYKNVNYKCQCGEKKSETIENLLNNNIYDEKTNNYKNIKNKDSEQKNENNDNDITPTKQFVEIENEEKEEKENKPHLLTLKCEEHKELFAYYCKEYRLNICRNCVFEFDNHLNHHLDLFDKKIYIINKIITNIKEDLEQKENDSTEIKQFKELMSIIINDYKNYPNYSHFDIIELCSDFLQKKNIDSTTNLNNNDEKENYLYIKSSVELDNNFNNAKLIKKISINKFNPNILSSIQILGQDLINLNELDLKENSIKDISLLTNIKLENLEILNLACNEIDDSNLEYFFQLDFPKLRFLNLFQNKLTNPKLLKLKNDTNKFPKLEIFYIGNNKFIFNNDNKNDIYDFSSVLEIGLSRNFFNSKSIEYIRCFTLTNLEIIYLSYNNLENLDFVKNLDLPSIVEFWINYNNLKTFEQLKKYKTLEIIEMKNNNINYIGNIKNFVLSFNGLKKFNLEGNKIQYDMLNNIDVDAIIQEYKIQIIINPS